MSRTFLDRMRAKAEPGFLWRDLKHIAGAVLLVVWGVFGLSVTTDSVAMSALLLLAGIAWASYIVHRYRARSKRANDPFDAAIAALGNRETIAADLEADFADRSVDALPLQIGRRYLCFARGAEIAVVPLDQLVWVYIEAVGRRLPIRPRHQLVLWRRDGTADNLLLWKSELETCIRRLHAAAPWLQFGYDEVRKETWNADRADFIAMVDGERARHAAQAR